MASILVRNKPVRVPNGSPTDLMLPEWNIIVKDTTFGEGIQIWSNLNIYGASIGEACKIGSFVEIRKGVAMGPKCKIEPFVFIPEGVTLGTGVFIGPNVTFTNDVYPRACNEDGSMISDYRITPTRVEDFSSIGAGCVIRCGVTIGRSSMIGAGSLVIKDVGPREVWYSIAATRRGKVLHIPNPPAKLRTRKSE